MSNLFKFSTKWRPKLLRFLIIVAVPLFLYFGIFQLPGRLISISDVQCKNQEGDCSQTISQKLSTLSGKSLNEVKNGSKKVLMEDVRVESFTYQLKLPNKIEFLIKEKKPEFAVTVDGKSFRLVDNTGLLLAEAGSTELPKLTVSSGIPEVGKKVSTKILFALQIMRDLGITLDVESGAIKEDSLVIELRHNLNVIFPIEGDREALLGSLILLYSRLEEGDKLENNENIAFANIKTIDLRFKNPVLKAN